MLARRYGMEMDEVARMLTARHVMEMDESHG
jgi:hypothetical protein